jgi:two-component system, cell cycle sensor histidine kinase and response regulator CckA
LNFLIGKTLEREGWTIASALSGKEALAKAVAIPRLLLVLDYMLRDMTGQEVVESLQKQNLLVPFLVMTGRGDEKTAVAMMSLGARDYIIKGAEFIDRLPQAIKRVCVELDNEEKLVLAEEQIKMLAKFPAENPSPVLRISRQGIILYANKQAEILLKNWKCEVDQVLPDKWLAMVREAQASGNTKDSECECEERYFLLRFAPISGTNYLNIYGLDITEQKFAEQALRESEKKYRILVENMNEGIWGLDQNGQTMFVNQKMADILGYTMSEIMNRTLFHFMKEKDVTIGKQMLERNKQGTKEHQMFELIIKDGKNIYASMETAPLIDDGGTYMGIIACVQDITQERTTKKREELAVQVLGFLNQADKKTDLVRNITLSIKLFTGIQAIGIRLREGEDFPYIETNGFAEHFVEKEKYLCARDQTGKLVRNTKGKPYLECMCGNILTGRIDPSLPFFTEAGSFWINSTSELLTTTTEKERQGRTRNRCNSEGYESVALIPLRNGREIIGLLQLNDQRKGVFTPEMIRFFEGIGTSIGIGMAHKQAEEQLRQINQRLDTLLSSLYAGVLTTSQDGEVEHVNQAFCDLFKLSETPADLRGLSSPEMLKKISGAYASPAATLARIQELTIQGKPVKGEEIAMRDGRCFVVDFIPIMDKDGKGCGRIWHHQDITGRKQAEAALRATEVRYRRLFESAKDGILILDAATGMVVDVNPFLMTLLGYTHEKLMGKTIWEMGFFKDVIKNRDNFLKLQQDGYVRYEDLPLEAIDGRHIDVEFVSNVYLVENKKVIQCNIRDITERKTVEKALRESEVRFRELYDHINSGVAVYEAMDDGQDFIFKDFNQAGEKIDNIKREKLIGQRLTQMRPGVKEFGLLAVLRQVWQTGEPMRHPVKFYHDDRISGWYENYIYKLPTGELVAVFENVTERKRLEEEREKMQAQLLQAQKLEAVGTLAGGVAHDFNNLLTIIKGNAELMLMRMNNLDPFHSETTQIKTASERAANLTRQLLLFSRKQPMETVAINLNDIIGNLLKMLKRLIGEDIVVETGFEPQSAMVMADPGSIEQVIMNLAVNARDAMPGGGTLTITTSNVTVDQALCVSHPEAKPGQYVLLAVRDTGTGIPTETIRRIFEPFFTTKEQGKGTGLGLSVVYGIVQAHHGWISVTSELDKGTLFKIYFPAIINEAAVPDGRESGLTSKELAGHNERILLVEDEAEVRRVTRTMLEQHGYIVIEAESIKEAKAICKQQQGNFALVFSDVVLTDGSGVKLVDNLKEEWPALKVLFASGYPDMKSQWSVIREKKYNYLQKPFTLQELLKAVKNALGAAGGGDETAFL